MSELIVPDRVIVDKNACFDNPEIDSLPRIAVATRFRVDGDALTVRAGISDGGLHDDLARKVGPANSKTIRLPAEMSSTHGAVLGAYDPTGDHRGGRRLYLIAGQIYRLGYNPNSPMGFEQTDKCLDMAALALGLLLRRCPEDLMGVKDPRNLMFGSKILKHAERDFGNRIFS